MAFSLYHALMFNEELDQKLSEYDQDGTFLPFEFKVTEETRSIWVRMKKDPVRFEPKIFDGEWAFNNLHPENGNLRVVRAIRGKDEISRVVARQGKYIYAYPWFK
jgi:hypothetical protein